MNAVTVAHLLESLVLPEGATVDADFWVFRDPRSAETADTLASALGLEAEEYAPGRFTFNGDGFSVTVVGVG